MRKPITNISELRGVFIFEGIYAYDHDWNLVAETLANLGVNAVFVNDQSTCQRRPYDEIRTAIDAFHTRGIQYHSVMAVLQDTKWADGSTHTCAIKPDGGILSPYSHCPIKIHDYVIAAIKDYFSKFPDVDGLMLDFIRYAGVDPGDCYCELHRQAFEEYLGETITDWAPFVYPDGSRYIEFLDWRPFQVDDLVRDIHETIKSIDKDIVISAAVWTLDESNPIYWRKFKGQDTARWVKEGWIDIVAPMIYVKTVEQLESYVRGTIKWWGGGTNKGNVALAALLRNDREDENLTPEELKAQIDLVREYGLHGWIIWRYGGPGESHPGMDADIRDYLSIVDMPPTFSIEDFQVQLQNSSVKATWKTTLPATSKLEYSPTPLFTASWERWRDDVHYWLIQYNKGNILEDATLSTVHSLSFQKSPAAKCYMRASSSNESGEVVTFIVAVEEQHSTPFSQALEEGSYLITVPETVEIEGKTYRFKQWEDGSTSTSRQVNLTEDISIIAYYEEVTVPPKPVPPIALLVILAGIFGIGYFMSKGGE